MLYVLEDEITMHANASCSGSFAIKIASAGEIVQRRLEGKLKVRSARM